MDNNEKLYKAILERYKTPKKSRVSMLTICKRYGTTPHFYTKVAAQVRKDHGFKPNYLPESENSSVGVTDEQLRWAATQIAKGAQWSEPAESLGMSAQLLRNSIQKMARVFDLDAKQYIERIRNGDYPEQTKRFKFDWLVFHNRPQEFTTLGYMT